MISRLTETLEFPDPRVAIGNIVAYGGDLSVERLLLAYEKGIFPWYDEENPILWYCPLWRMVLYPSRLHVSRSLRRTLNKSKFTIRCDTAFDEVISSCATVKRPNSGRWLHGEMVDAYCRLHREGYAHSYEAWQRGRLVGGVYGISLGAVFFAESMFTYEDDASKVALVHLVEQLEQWCFHFVDCQVYTENSHRFGACLIPRSDFLDQLEMALAFPTRRGPWQLEKYSKKRGNDVE